MQERYETKITNARWIAYDLPGNAGWILYLAMLVRLLGRRSSFLEVPATRVLILLAVIPAILMLIGIAELISERIQKLDRILPRNRLLRGFGALTLGGILGAVIAAVLAIAAGLTGESVAPALLLGLGGLLCGLFAGLIYGGYRRTA